MRVAGYEPLEPYLSAAAPWSCRHAACGEVVRVKASSVRSGYDPCPVCRAEGYRQRAAARRTDPAEATALMRAHGFEPLEPYPGSSVGWHCRCTTCGKESKPLYWCPYREGMPDVRHPRNRPGRAGEALRDHSPGVEHGQGRHRRLHRLQLPPPAARAPGVGAVPGRRLHDRRRPLRRRTGGTGPPARRQAVSVPHQGRHAERVERDLLHPPYHRRRGVGHGRGRDPPRTRRLRSPGRRPAPGRCPVRRRGRRRGDARSRVRAARALPGAHERDLALPVHHVRARGPAHLQRRTEGADAASAPPDHRTPSKPRTRCARPGSNHWRPTPAGPRTHGTAAVPAGTTS